MRLTKTRCRHPASSPPPRPPFSPPAQRNYRYFLLFVFSATLLCVWVTAFSCVHIFLRYEDARGDALSERASVTHAFSGTGGAAVAVAAYTLVFLLFVGGLSGFHCYLTGTNQTTYENFR